MHRLPVCVLIKISRIGAWSGWGFMPVTPHRKGVPLTLPTSELVYHVDYVFQRAGWRRQVLYRAAVELSSSDFVTKPNGACCLCSSAELKYHASLTECMHWRAWYRTSIGQYINIW